MAYKSLVKLMMQYYSYMSVELYYTVVTLLALNSKHSSTNSIGYSYYRESTVMVSNFNL